MDHEGRITGTTLFAGRSYKSSIIPVTSFFAVQNSKFTMYERQKPTELSF